MEKKTQTGEVLKYLRKHPKGITPKEAERMFGTMRLSSIIHRLRHNRGLDIETVDEYVKNRYGSTSKYARYVLHEG